MRSSIAQLINWLTESLAYLGAILGSPAIVATSFRMAFRQKKILDCRDEEQKRVIILTKPGGLEDIFEAYSDRPAGYSLVLFNRRLLRVVAYHYLGQEIVNDWKYWETEEKNKEKNEKYFKFLRKVLKILKRHYNVHGFIQFNVIYLAERQLANACNYEGLKFVTLQKECMYSKKSVIEAAKMLQNRLGVYGGSKFITYNQRLADAFVKIGFLDSSTVKVTGCPRLDFCHRLRTEKEHTGKDIVFFAIQPDAGVYHLNYLSEKDKISPIMSQRDVPDVWGTVIKQVNEAFINLAFKNPSLKFVFKPKPGHEDVQMESLEGRLPPNLEISFVPNSHELLERASVVIGFNSTIVLEAVAAGIPTIVPYIFDKKQKSLTDYLHEVKNGVQIASNIQEFEELVIKNFHQPFRNDLSEEQVLILENLLGNSDGDASTRLKFTLDEIFSPS